MHSWSGMGWTDAGAGIHLRRALGVVEGQQLRHHPAADPLAGHPRESWRLCKMDSSACGSMCDLVRTFHPQMSLGNRMAPISGRPESMMAS